MKALLVITMLAMSGCDYGVEQGQVWTYHVAYEGGYDLQGFPGERQHTMEVYGITHGIARMRRDDGIFMETNCQELRKNFARRRDLEEGWKYEQ